MRLGGEHARHDDGQFEHWRQAVSTAFVPLAVVSTAEDGEARFTGTLRTTALGGLQLSEVGGRAVDVRRTRTSIKRSDPGLVKVGLQLSGRGVIVQDDREAVLGPGDFAVYDTSKPYDLHFAGDFSMFVLMFPREMLRIASRELGTVSARRIRGSSGMGALVSPFLTNLHHSVVTGTMPTTPLVEDAVVDLLSAAVQSEAPADAAAPGATLLLRVKSFIDAHLHDPALDTATVASHHHVSTRHLQKMFEADGQTVAGWIRHRRLEKCRRDLKDARFRDESIGTICARYGLVNSSHFSRLFKDTYGVSPRAFREQELLPISV